MVPVKTINPLDAAIQAADKITDGGGVARIAQACGTSKQFIHNMRRQWRQAGRPPWAMRDHAPAIEMACGRAVTVEPLMPDVDWRRDDAGVVIGYCVPVAPLGDFGAAANDDAPPPERNGAGGEGG